MHTIINKFNIKRIGDFCHISQPFLNKSISLLLMPSADGHKTISSASLWSRRQILGWKRKKKREVNVQGKNKTLECVGGTFAHAHKTFARRRTRSPAFASKSLVTSITRYQDGGVTLQLFPLQTEPCQTHRNALLYRERFWTEPRRGANGASGD